MDYPEYFPCQQCSRRVFLIRNLCEICAPELHKNHDDWMSFIRKASTEFKKQTSKESLSDWFAFEKYLEEIPLETWQGALPLEFTK